MYSGITVFPLCERTQVSEAPKNTETIAASLMCDAAVSCYAKTGSLEFAAGVIQVH
jgi:hypothetical protein